MINDKTRYAYRLIKAKCSCGDKTFTQYLNLPKDHGVYFQEEEFPLLNANDHTANENILGFGRCHSGKRGRDNLGGTMLSSVLFGPALGGVVRDLVGSLCEPMTVVPWRFVDENYLIDGAPAITVKSELSCYYGGTITIVVEDIGADDSDDTEEETENDAEKETEKETPPDYDKKDKLPSEVKELITDFCDSEAPEIESKGDMILQIEASLTPELLEEISSMAESADESAIVNFNN